MDKYPVAYHGGIYLFSKYCFVDSTQKLSNLKGVFIILFFCVIAGDAIYRVPISNYPLHFTAFEAFHSFLHLHKLF